MTTGLDTEAVPGRTASPDLRGSAALPFIGDAGRSRARVIASIPSRHGNCRRRQPK